MDWVVELYITIHLPHRALKCVMLCSSFWWQLHVFAVYLWANTDILILVLFLLQKHCRRSIAELRRRFKPSLFQHIGTHSSLKGKIQKLKVSFNSSSRHPVHIQWYLSQKPNCMSEVHTYLSLQFCHLHRHFISAFRISRPFHTFTISNTTKHDFCVICALDHVENVNVGTVFFFTFTQMVC